MYNGNSQQANSKFKILDFFNPTPYAKDPVLPAVAVKHFKTEIKRTNPDV